MERSACARLLLAAALGSVSTVTPAQGVETCHKVNAKAEGRLLTQTPAGATTESRLIGGGQLHGTTVADLAFTSIDPATGIATYEGELVLTTMQGTVTYAIVDGIFNLVTGEFSNDSAVVGGTGRFAGASGDLFFHGFVFADGTFIDDELSGTICVLRP